MSRYDNYAEQERGHNQYEEYYRQNNLDWMVSSPSATHSSDLDHRQKPNSTQYLSQEDTNSSYVVPSSIFRQTEVSGHNYSTMNEPPLYEHESQHMGDVSYASGARELPPPYSRYEAHQHCTGFYHSPYKPVKQQSEDTSLQKEVDEQHDRKLCTPKEPCTHQSNGGIYMTRYLLPEPESTNIGSPYSSHRPGGRARRLISSSLGNRTEVRREIFTKADVDRFEEAFTVQVDAIGHHNRDHSRDLFYSGLTSSLTNNQRPAVLEDLKTRDNHPEGYPKWTRPDDTNYPHGTKEAYCCHICNNPYATIKEAATCFRTVYCLRWIERNLKLSSETGQIEGKKGDYKRHSRNQRTYNHRALG